MTDQTPNFNDMPSFKPVRRPLFAARKIALMASVVAGLGVAAYGLSPAPHDVFSTAAHAQVDKQVKAQATAPAGFADIVERVKPSVISVKVNMKEKVSSREDGNGNNEDSPFQPGSPMERFFKRFGRKSVV